MNEKIKYSLTLLVLCAVMAGILAWIYTVTAERIDAQKAEKKKAALTKMSEYLGVEFDTTAKKFTPESKGGKEAKPVEFFEVKEKGKQELYGYGIIAAEAGYSSDVTLMVLAVKDKDGKFRAKLARVTQSAETPGLGERIKDEPVLYTLYDMAADKDKVEKAKQQKTWPTFMMGFNDKSKEEIDSCSTISGATISSKAVMGAMKKALEYAEMISKGQGKIEDAK